MFAAARAAAGRARDDVPGDTVAEVLAAARERYGQAFAEVLGSSRIWVNGEPANDATAIRPGDEVAVLPPVSGGAGGGQLTVAELKARRSELQALDDAVSYVRRVAQGRADLARDALERASDDGDPTPVHVRGDISGGLRDVLADRLIATGGRPPRPAEDFSDHPLSAELDEICTAGGFHRLETMSRPQVEALVAAIDRFEQRVSAQRKQIFAELDALTDELVDRYRATVAEDDDD